MINTKEKLLSSSWAQTVGGVKSVRKGREVEEEVIQRDGSDGWTDVCRGDGQTGESWVDTKTMARALNTLCSALAMPNSLRGVITLYCTWTLTTTSSRLLQQNTSHYSCCSVQTLVLKATQTVLFISR